MTSLDSPTRGPARPGPYIISGILIAVAIIMPLLVPMYARHDPVLWGIPFFYWYQLLWVFIASGLLAIAYLIMRKEDRRRRAAVRGEEGDR
jgi:predicted membrane protein